MDFSRLKQIIESIFWGKLSGYLEEVLKIKVNIDCPILNNPLYIYFVNIDNNADIAVFNLWFLCENGSILVFNNDIHKISLQTCFLHRSFADYSNKTFNELLYLKDDYIVGEDEKYETVCVEGGFLFKPTVYIVEYLSDFLLDSLGLKESFNRYLKEKELSELNKLRGEEIF